MRLVEVVQLGNDVGGRVADRFPFPALLFGITALAATAAGVIPFVSRPILDASLRAFADFAAKILSYRSPPKLVCSGSASRSLNVRSPAAFRSALRNSALLMPLQ